MHNVFNEGVIHVCRAMCSTCIFRPGNLMDLEEGRVEGMIKDAVADESTIVCHQTLDTPQNAACRGFFDRHKTQPLQIAERLDVIRWHKP